MLLEQLHYLAKYKKEYGNCHFTWITHSPQVVPKDEVDVIYKWDESSVSFWQIKNLILL